ncbi:MAG TPA: branched-chain amino acid aminotransferase [Armatimonadota bacterium]|nr:branched-chain amino acid aminotransferase [Armatimonadota bacterium]
MNLDWKNLSFQYMPTNGFVQVDYANGEWGTPEIKTDPFIPLHIAASCLHYGQACFEGAKAFRTRSGDIVLFRPDENARRIAFSADRICMQAPPEELFMEACQMVIRANAEFVPPYGTGASLYVRPLLIGTEPTVGIKASDSYTFIILVTPVGPYYKDGFSPVDAVVIEGYDRAAPHGTGQAKVGGNYAASLKPGYMAKKLGYPVELFTDPRENKYVDEFGTSNFIGITHNGEYKTPSSSSILASITNKSLQVLAEDMGLKIVREPIALDSLDQFAEVGACGTAAVITPISAVHYREKVFRFGKPDEAGPTLTKLFHDLQGIQYGEIADRHNWLMRIDVDTPSAARA